MPETAPAPDVSRQIQTVREERRDALNRKDHARAEALDKDLTALYAQQHPGNANVTGSVTDGPEPAPTSPSESALAREASASAQDADGRQETPKPAGDAAATVTLPAVAPEATAAAFSLMRESEPALTAALEREWGAGAGQNLGYVKWVVETFGLQEELRALPNDPATIRAAAMLGRRLFHGDEAELPSGAHAAALKRQIDGLRRQRREAETRRDDRAVSSINAQLAALYSRLAPGSRAA